MSGPCIATWAIVCVRTDCSYTFSWASLLLVYLWLCDGTGMIVVVVVVVVAGFKINANRVNNNINEWRYFRNCRYCRCRCRCLLLLLLSLLLFVHFHRNLSCAHEVFTLCIVFFLVNLWPKVNLYYTSGDFVLFSVQLCGEYLWIFIV